MATEGEQHITIPRVRESPKREVRLRGKTVQAVQPLVGSVVTCADNGYASRIGCSESFVVTRLHCVKKTGTVTGVTLAPIVRLDAESVTYDGGRLNPGPQLFNNGGGDEARWEDRPTHNMYYYTWDKYAPKIDGDWNK